MMMTQDDITHTGKERTAPPPMSEDFNYAKQVTDLLKSINEGIWKIEKNTSRIDRRLHFR